MIVIDAQTIYWLYMGAMWAYIGIVGVPLLADAVERRWSRLVWWWQMRRWRRVPKAERLAEMSRAASAMTEAVRAFGLSAEEARAGIARFREAYREAIGPHLR